MDKELKHLKTDLLAQETFWIYTISSVFPSCLAAYLVLKTEPRTHIC